MEGSFFVCIKSITVYYFEEVDQQTPTTNIDFSADLLDEPVNLSFED